MKYITEQEIVSLFRDNVKGTTVITVELDSNMDGSGKMLKTGNPFINLGMVKRETLNGVIGYDYGAAVNRLAGKEDKEERECKIHPWGDMDDKRLFRIHRKTFAHYLTMKVQNCEVKGYFLPDNTEIPKEQVKPFLPQKSKSSTQADLDGEVIARDYSLKNIMSIKAFGNIYYVTHEDIQEQEKKIAAQEIAATIKV